jgi:YD repeat-containing protein
VVQSWSDNLPPNASTSGANSNAYVKTEYRFLNSTAGLKPASIQDYKDDKNGNLLLLVEYDCLVTSCGSISPTQLPASLGSLAIARQTEYTYGTSTPAADTAPVSGQADAYWNQSAPRLLNAKKSVRVVGAGVMKYSELSYDDARGRGNVLQQLDYDSTKPNGFAIPLSKDVNAVQAFAADYDASGNVLHHYDGKGTPTLYEYGTGSCMNSYATVITASYGITGEALPTHMTPDCQSGLLIGTIDANSVSTGYTYDVFGRVRSITEGVGSDQRFTSITYSDVNRTATTVTPLDSGRSLTSHKASMLAAERCFRMRPTPITRARNGLWSIAT